MKKRFRLLTAAFAAVGLLSALAQVPDPDPDPARAPVPSGAPPARVLSSAPVKPDALRSQTGALAKVDPALLAGQGEVTVVIRLKEAPLAVAAGPNAKRQTPRLNAAQQRAYHRRLTVAQGPVVNAVTRNGGKVIGRLTRVLNAVIANVDAAAIPRLAELATVVTIRPVGNYELDLSNTVPYVGAAALHGLGTDGTGVRVAVLDSGVDYTHWNLGGSGILEDYADAYGSDPDAPENKTLDGLFPTSKVIGGFDFVGEVWPNGALAPDPDPIDFQGHGTHVADIIAGESQDGVHVGVAPGAELYAFKVCSAVATSCSGVAILEGLDAAADPDNNGDTSDAVDVVNMSLGLGYGQIQDDSALAVQNLVDFGVVVVASAGNAGDKPYVVGSPSIAPGAISVAETQVPGAVAISLRVEQSGAETVYPNTATLEWAPVTGEVSGQLVYVGRGCPDDPNTPAPADELDPYPTGLDLTGKIALIDRGACNVSLKIDRAADAGAIGVLIANNVAGDPPGFSYGGGDTMVPTLVVSQADGTALKTKLALPDPVTATYSPDVGTVLVGSMVSTSSRGPAPSSQAIKPDLGAPGASVSAQVGTGDGETAFGGTSGAAPMVSGAAALLIEAFPSLAPHEVKARLMNTAERSILINPITLPGVLAPITRIGAGEVRVDRAYTTESIAYDRDTKTASLSFGYRSVNGASPVTTFRKTIEICNLGENPCTYTPENLFRYAEDAALGAVTVNFAPASVEVLPGGKGYVRMSLAVNPSLLPDWAINGGNRGGNGEWLRLNEFDGHVLIRCGADETIALPWHILPRKAADMRPDATEVQLAGDPWEETGSVTIENTYGSEDGASEVFDLLGTSPLDYPTSPPPGANYALVDLKAFGARAFLSGGVPYVQFAVSTHGEPAHPNYPAGLEIDIDVTGEGDPDYYVYHKELTGFTLTGQNVTAVYDIANETETIRLFSDCDLHSGAMVFTVRLSDLGLTLGDSMQMIVWGYDNYFTGWVTDWITDGPDLILYTPGLPRFYADAFTVAAPPGGSGLLGIWREPFWSQWGDIWSPSHTGFLLFHRQATTRRWTDEIRVTLP